MANTKNVWFKCPNKLLEQVDAKVRERATQGIVRNRTDAIIAALLDWLEKEA